MAKEDAPKLSDFEGVPVVAVGVEMPNAAGGLQEAMKFDPVEWHHGDTGFIVLKYTCAKVRFDPIERGATEPLRRVHILHVDQAAPIDESVVAIHLQKHADRVKKAKEEAEGVQRIPGVDEEGEGGDNVHSIGEAAARVAEGMKPEETEAEGDLPLGER